MIVGGRVKFENGGVRITDRPAWVSISITTNSRAARTLSEAALPQTRRRSRDAPACRPELEARSASLVV